MDPSIPCNSYIKGVSCPILCTGVALTYCRLNKVQLQSRITHTEYRYLSLFYEDFFRPVSLQLIDMAEGVVTLSGLCLCRTGVTEGILLIYSLGWRECYTGAENSEYFMWKIVENLSK